MSPCEPNRTVVDLSFSSLRFDRTTSLSIGGSTRFPPERSRVRNRRLKGEGHSTALPTSLNVGGGATHARRSTRRCVAGACRSGRGASCWKEEGRDAGRRVEDLDGRMGADPRRCGGERRRKEARGFRHHDVRTRRRSGLTRLVNARGMRV